MLRSFSFQLKNQSRWKILPRFSWVHAYFKHDCAISENRAEELGAKKSWTFSTFLADFLSWNFNSQSNFVLISTTFFSVASRNEKAGEIYPEFGDSAIWIFFFSETVLSSGCESISASSCWSSCSEVFWKVKYSKVTQSTSTGVACDLRIKDVWITAVIQESKSSNVLVSILKFLKKYSLSKNCKSLTSIVNKIFSSLSWKIFSHSVPLLTFIFNLVLSLPIN